MRYVGLIFLGMVLWAGQAMAAELDMERSEQILIKGKIVHERFIVKDRSYEFPRVTRVLYKGDLYICTDYLSAKQVNFRCFDDKPDK